MGLLTFIAGSLVGAVLLAVPGCLAGLCAHASIRREGASAAEGVGVVLVALGWGCGVVPGLALVLSLATGVRVGWPGLALASLASAGVAAAVLFRRRSGPLGFERGRLLAALRAALPVLAAGALVGFLWFVTCDQRSHVTESCMFRTAYAAAGYTAPMSEVPPDIDLLRENVQDARLGNVGVLAAFLVLFQGLGFRLLFAVCGVLLALGGYAIGSWTGGGRLWGWVGLATLALNPYSLSLPMVDENLLTLAFAGTVIPFVAARGGGWAMAGALFGLVVAMRHVMLPALPAMLLAARYSRASWRGLGSFLGAFAVACIPVALHHHLALGSVLRFESNELFLPFSYRLAGIGFEFEGLLNWPFHDHVVRTPHNPLPMFAAWPLHLVDHLGTVLAAAAIVGLVAMGWRSWRTAAFWLLWAPVVMTGVAFQEGWDIGNKMWVMLIVLGAVVAWVVGGLAWIAQRPRVGVPVLIALVILLQAGALLVRGWEVPPDERYICIEPGVGPELDLDAAGPTASRREATAVAPWPDLGRLGHNGPYLAAQKISGVFGDLASPGIPTSARPWGWFPREPPPAGPPVTVELDLSAVVHGRTDFARLTTDPPDIDLTIPGTAVTLQGPTVPWSPHPLVLYAGRSEALSAAVLFFDADLDGECAEWKEPRDERLEVQRCWALFTLLGEEERCDDLEPGGVVSDRLRLRVPAGALSLAVEQSIGPDRLFLWKGHVSSDDVTLAEPFVPWKN